jgi:hypothetical protein
MLNRFFFVSFFIFCSFYLSLCSNDNEEDDDDWISSASLFGLAVLGKDCTDSMYKEGNENWNWFFFL